MPGPATAAALTRETAVALANLLAVLADNRYFLGRRLSEWIIKAPALEQGVACAAISGEEMGFARVLYGLLEQISAPDKPVPLVRGADRELRYCVSYLDHPFDSWAMVVTALAVIDPALTVMCEVAARSPYNPLAVRAGRILDEESFHDRYAVGRLHDAASRAEVASRVQAGIDEVWPEMVMWFGREDSTRWPALTQAGIIPKLDGPAETYESRVAARLEETGFNVPAETMRRPEELRWDLWDPVTRRLRIRKGVEAGS